VEPDRNFEPAIRQYGFDTGGIMAGGQFGCDYQVGAVVFGIRNIVNWADLKSSVGSKEEISTDTR